MLESSLGLYKNIMSFSISIENYLMTLTKIVVNLRQKLSESIQLLNPYHCTCKCLNNTFMQIIKCIIDRQK